MKDKKSKNPVKPEKGSSSGEELIPYDPLTHYIIKAKRFPLLTEEEERELVSKYRVEGDKNAAYRLVTSHLMLVVKIAMSFRRYYINIMELVQEGNTGLMEAVKKFDPLKGARLSTYATWWIRAFILKYLVDNLRIVKVGTTNARRKLLFKLRGEIERLQLEGYSPEPKMLAEHFDVDERDIIDVSATLSHQDLSLDAPVSEDSRESLIDMFASKGVGHDEALEKNQLRQAFRESIAKFEKTLKENAKKILRERILAEKPLTLKEIGDEFGVTKEAVRQTEERLKKKLIEFLRKELEHHV